MLIQLFLEENMKQKLSLTEGKISKTLIQFSFPFLIANLLQSIYGSADILVVGKFAESDSVSAVSIGFQVMRLIIFMVLGLSMGGSVLAGQYYGAKKEKEAAKTIGNLLVVFAACTVFLTVTMLLLTRPIVQWMQTPAEAVQKAEEYLFICFSGIVFYVSYNVIVNVLRGLGDSKAPLYFVGIACATNILFDFILVGGLHMESAGAAVASVASQAVSSLFAFLYIRKRGFFSLPIEKSDIRPDLPKIKKILSIGLPVAFQNGLVTISFLIVTALTNTMGVVVSAAVGVVEKTLEFSMIIPISFSMALGAITAQNIGANKPERARAGLKVGIGISFVVSILFCLTTQIVPQSLTALLSKDAAVIETAASYLRSYSLDGLPLSFVMCLNAYFNGQGRTVFTMAQSLLTTFLVRLPISYLVYKSQGTLYQLGFAAPITTLVALVMCALYFIYLHKKAKVETPVFHTEPIMEVPADAEE